MFPINRQLVVGFLAISFIYTCILGLVVSHISSNDMKHPILSWKLVNDESIQGYSSPNETKKATYNYINNVKAYKQSSKELRFLIDDEKQRKLKINCSLIFNGNVNELKKARSLKYSNYNKKLYPKVTKNCTSYKHLRRYVTDKEVSLNERSFPLAYSIVIHRDVDGFERLLRLLYRPHNVYCVHVDLKSPASFFVAVSSIIRCFSNVFLVSKREVVVYAGFTRLKADLNCFADLLNYEWKYVLNYAGEELPLRPNNQLVEILKIYNDSNIVVSQTEKLNHIRWKYRYTTVVNETAKTGYIQKLRQLKNPPPFNLRITKGSAYGMFTREFVRFVLRDKKAQKFLKWCSTTYSPDEHFWATLNNAADNPHMGTPGAGTGTRVMRAYIGRYAAWYPKSCHGQTIRSLCVFGAGDLPLLFTKKELVANKFRMTVDAVTVDCIDQLMSSRAQESLTPLELEHYREKVRQSHWYNHTNTKLTQPSASLIH